MQASWTAKTACAAIAFAALCMSTASAQDVDELEPAVDTSVEDFGPAVDTSAGSFEPAVDTSAGAFDDDGEQALPVADNAQPQPTSGVMDRLTLSRTEITGNQELPKVMYIVPWKKSDPGDLMGRPVNTLLDEVLAPIDREEFVRQVDYYADLNGKEDSD